MGQLLPRSLPAVLFFLCLASVAVAQQRYHDVWFFGGRHSIDFRNGTVNPTTGALETLEGCAAICNPATGAPLFYTNGATVWNRLDRVMQNGTNLFGNLSCSQSSLIVPQPGSSSLYYVFTLDGTTSGGPREPQGLGIRYSVVDMTQDAGLGAVIIKNVSLLPTAGEKVTAVRHINGCDYWIVTHELENNKFYAWLLTRDGLYIEPVISAAGMSYGSQEAGYLKASPDGTLLFAARSFISYNRFNGELFRFDASTGAVGPMVESIPSGYGASFSPDNHFLYASRNDSLYQYDLRAVPGRIAATAVLLNDPEPDRMFYALQMAPDGKVYAVEGPVFSSFTSVDMKIGAVNNPNTAGMAADYRTVFNYPNVSFFSGLPNCIDGYLGMSGVGGATSSEREIDAEDTVVCVGGSVRLTARGGSRYRWFPSTGLNCDTCASVIARPDTTTTYHLMSVDTLGCSGLDSITIYVRKPRISAGPDTALQCGDSIRLKGSGAKFYRWSPSEGLSCDDCPDPVVAPKATTTYYLQGEDTLGCTGIDSVTVVVLDTDVNAGVDTSVCIGSSVRLRATGRREYRWSPSESLSCDDCPNPLASPTETTMYVVQGTTNGACLSFDTVVVTVHPAPFADAGPDTVICLGDSVRLSARGDGSFRWTPLVNVLCPDCPDPVVFPRESITYYLQVTNGEKCSTWDSVRVEVKTGGSVIADGDTAFCAGGRAQLSARGATEYAWSPAATLSCADCPNPVATPTGTTVYYVIGSNGSQACAAIDSVVVTVHEPPVADAGSDTAMCEGAAVQLNATGGMWYRWDASSDLSCVDCPDPLASPTKSVVYYVTAFNDDGCESRDSVLVTVHPGLTISAGEDRAICGGESVTLEASGGVRWLWEPSEGLSCVDCAEPVASPASTTTYRLTAWNAEGCEATDDVTVIVREQPEIVRLRIGRAYHGRTGEPIEIAVEFIETVRVTDVSELEMELRYDPRTMQVDAGSIERQLTGTALQGWSVEVKEHWDGLLIIGLTAPAGSTLAGSGALLRFDGKVFLSNVRGTELPFTVRSPSRCFAFEAEPGYARVDSICGLNLRLIEITAAKYVAPVAYPNPAVERVTFAFGLGLDGITRLEVFDALGRRVGLIAEGMLESGRYQVEWDVRDVASGGYWYRLTSGDWSASGRLMVEE